MTVRLVDLAGVTTYGRTSKVSLLPPGGGIYLHLEPKLAMFSQKLKKSLLTFLFDE